jgi:hypothetical protein
MKRKALKLAASVVALLAITATSWAQEPEPDRDPDTLYALAESHAAVAEYEESARLYEQFAEQEPYDVRALTALDNAYLFRLGLDQRDAAKRDLVAYERLYGPDERDNPKLAAGIFWTQQDLLDSTKARRKHALEYLAIYEVEGGIDRAVVAHAVIAQIDWRASCRHPLLFDSCIAIEREPASQTKRPRRPERCGLPTHSIITVHRRDTKLAASAQDRFVTILKLIRKHQRADLPITDLERERDFADAWAMAMVYQADAQYEESSKIDVPEDLDFFLGTGRDSGDPVAERRYKAQRDKREDSAKRLDDFLEQKRQFARELRDPYSEVRHTGSPYWSIVAAFRVASLTQNVADQLYRAKLPTALRSDKQIEVYCEYLAKEAKPVEEQAIAAWTYCVERSTELLYFTEFSRLCEAELQVRDPKRYPTTHELFGESVYAGTGLKSVGVLPEPCHDE